MLKRCVFLAALVGLTVMASAQSELSGRDQFPQFRGLSALPGGAFALGPDGNPDANGAMSFSTPIGFCLGHYRLSFGASTISKNSSFAAFKGDKGSSDGNGTAYLMGGAELGSAGRVTVGFMVLSSFGDNAWNIQFQPGQQKGPVWYSVGVQDVFGSGGSSGESSPGDEATSRSFYAVGTGLVAPNTYVSAGWGSRRFSHGFINASTNLGRDFKAVIEHDGFNVNAGLACTLGYDRDDRGRNVTIFLGYTRLKYLTWSVGATY